MTDIRTGGLARESLYAADGSLRIDGLVREVLRSTGTGAGTFISVDGLVREALIAGPAIASGVTQGRAWIMA